MKRLLILILILFAAAALCTTSCTHKTKALYPPFEDGSYPPDVAKIIVNRCAISGCHNQASYQLAAQLLLDSWQHLFQGSYSGAQVVAYSPLYSTLLYYVNTDSTRGQVAINPAHTFTPLSRDEYTILYNWISNGAPDKNGNIPFAAPNPDTRQKIYLTLQGCDLIGVIDAKTKLVMRYIHIGDANNQSPHDVEISEDGRYAYVPFYNGNYVQKIDVHTDTVAGAVDLSSTVAGGSGHWSIVALSPMDTAFLVSAWMGNGIVVGVNTATMQLNPGLSVPQFSGLFPYPHGISFNAAFDTFYSTLENSVIKYAFSSTGALAYHKDIPASGAPHQIEMTPDHSRYFVTCPPSAAQPAVSEVRVYDAHTDTLMKVIPVGTAPQEMDISPSKNYLFVTCMEDGANPKPYLRGSVYVIDYNTLATVKVIYGDFFQPHDITVDEQDGLVFIPSRNADPTGPAPHHSTDCGANARPGWYSVYDLNTLLPADNIRYDVPADPYAIGTRFK